MEAKHSTVHRIPTTVQFMQLTSFQLFRYDEMNKKYIVKVKEKIMIIKTRIEQSDC